MLSFQQREDDVDYHMMLILPGSYSKIKAILIRYIQKQAQNGSSWEVVCMMIRMIVVVLTIEMMMGSYKY